jgi:hypothetical protein
MRVFQKVVAGGGVGGGRIVGTDGVKRHTADAKFFLFFFHELTTITPLFVWYNIFSFYFPFLIGNQRTLLPNDT